MAVVFIGQIVFAIVSRRHQPRSVGPYTLDQYQRAGRQRAGRRRVLFTDYLLPFEVTSLLLVVALVGAIVLGKRKAQ